MNCSTYMQESARTVNTEMPIRERKLTAALGLMGEASELLRAVIVTTTDNQWVLTSEFDEASQALIAKELGDCWWYLAECHRLFNEPMSDMNLMTKDPEFYPWALASASFAVGELGTLAEAIKKNVAQGHDETLGPLLLHAQNILNVTALMFGLNSDNIRSANIEKLKRRYPDGFKPTDSVQRVDA